MSVVVLTDSEDGEAVFVDPLIHFENLVESSNCTVNNTIHGHKNRSLFFCCYHPIGIFR